MITNFFPQKNFRVLFLFFYFLSANVSAQSRFADDLNVSADYHYGFLLPEYSSLLYLAIDNIHSSSFNISKKTTGKNLWEQLYNYPEYGLSFFYSTLGNDEVHGSEFSLFPYFRLDIISGRRLDFYNETGIGVSYVTRKFDLENNYLNVAVGTHLNIHFNLKLGMEYKMPGKIRLHSGLSFDHFSNANAREPNLGLNYATLYAGLKYRVGDEGQKHVNDYADHKQDFHYEFICSAGRKHPRAIGSESYFTSSATFEFKWEAFRAVHFGVGADLFYDGATEAEMLTLELKNHKDLYDFRSGIHLSQELVYKNFSLIIQEGFYLLLTDRVDKHVMYNRGVFRYRISSGFFVQLAMKSHLHILDYPEFGLGITW
ncbi:MAG: acyloxyacyl hydrolase [Cyclobacteriaceae bacterium]